MSHAVAMQCTLALPRVAQRPQAPRRTRVVRAAASARADATPLPAAPRHAVLAAVTAFASASAGAALAAVEVVPLDAPVDVSSFTIYDYVTLAGPLLAYGVFYAIREKVSPRPQRRADAPASTPAAAAPAAPAAPTVVKAAPPPPPPPPAYTGPVTRLLSGRDAFDLTCNVAAELLQADRASFSAKTRLKDLGMTNEDAQDITRAIGERSGIAWQDADWQSMRMSLLQLSLLEISHLVSDRANVPRLDEWPVTAAPADAGDVDFV